MSSEVRVDDLQSVRYLLMSAGRRDQFLPAGNLHGDISAQSHGDRDAPEKRGVDYAAGSQASGDKISGRHPMHSGRSRCC
ncbi:hypothetical protein PLICRDRAFT_180979 [Plicaturopsis crispa FD-325 SS-3]|uniref:Uncharacterized protein n=1 Tax=Plicaturopsis crispa FD-325 SS-3 TaxID=944288 RepID=A0A0C9SJZ4_PLICR|nr:hypothetical protein PLICRDRAFT_180979 [Plicaturopsis crispa FD-325 SS-3]